MSKSPFHYSLVELANDNGVMGQVLRANQDYKWMLLAADKWAEQNLEQQIKDSDPDRLPFPDPWQFLLDAPAVSPIHKQVFRAAQSQLRAWCKLSRIARDEATLNTDWLEKMKGAKNERERMHAANKIIAARAKYELFNAHIQSFEPDHPIRAWGQQQIEKFQRERQKRGKGKQFQNLPRGKEFQEGQKLICALVNLWVRGANHAPGLMFFRNEAATDFLKFYLSQTHLTPLTVKKVRQQLGLIPVGSKNPFDKKHFVWEYKATTCETNKIKSVGYRRDGGIAFHGILERRKLAPNLSRFDN